MPKLMMTIIWKIIMIKTVYIKDNKDKSEFDEVPYVDNDDYNNI